MVMIFRRTRQRYQQGTDGVLSGALAQVNGTDGEVFNGNTGTNNGDRNKFYAPSRTWTSADLGRFIKLTSSPPTAPAGAIGKNRHDNFVFRIVEIVSATTIRLEGATFQDAAAAASITWKLMAAAVFTSAGASFPTDSVSGAGPVVHQFITLPTPASTNRELKLVPWIVGRQDSGTVVLISDWTGILNTFPTPSTLTWFLHDRQGINRFDLFQIMCRTTFDMGWSTLGGQSTGTVLIPAGGQASITNGKVVRIWDGTQKIIFEFNTGAAGAGHIRVPMTGGDNQATVLASFVSTVNSQGGFKITAQNNGGTIAGQAILYATTANNDTGSLTVTATLYPTRYTTGATTAPCFKGTNPLLSADSNDPITTDTVTPFVVTGMSGGQMRGQFRGQNLTNANNFFTYGDLILSSEGEAGSDGSNPKRQFLRFTHNDNASSTVNFGYDIAMWQSWDPEFSNATTNSMGNGINPLTSPHNPASANGFARNATTINTGNSGPAMSPSSPNNAWFVNGEGTTVTGDIAEPNSLGIFGGRLQSIDYAIMGDKDEVHFNTMVESKGANYAAFGSILEVQQNPRRFLLRAAVTTGANKVLNVGPVDPQGLTPPYQVGDLIQIAGKTVLAGAPSSGERVETATITAFGTTGTDNLDFTITVNNIAAAAGYQIGAMVGEEACGLVTFMGPHETTLGSSAALRFQNSAQFADATNLDYNGTTVSTQCGFVGQEAFGTLGSNVTTEVDPNLRGGRWGIIPVVCRNTVQGEFRGRLRYYFFTPNTVGNWQFIEDRNGNFYFILPYNLRQSQAQKFVLGPISNALAKPYT